MTDQTTYISNKQKKNQRVHTSFISNNCVINKIEYQEHIATPKSLLKFYSINKNSIDALTNNYLFAANPLSFNDPFDCPLQVWDMKMFSYDNISKLCPSEFHFLFSDDMVENRHVYFRNIWGSIGIICLNGHEPENQDLLWGHYTNQEGFAISFNVEDLVETWGEPFCIDYLEKEELDCFMVDENEQNGESSLIPKILRWTTQKKKSWITENEWRFVFFDCKVSPINFQTIIETRKKQIDKKIRKEIFLGNKFFKVERYVKQSENQFIYIVCEEDKYQKILLSYLAFPSKIKVSHMFMNENELQLYPRKCRIYNKNEGRFLIKYLD